MAWARKNTGFFVRQIMKANRFNRWLGLSAGLLLTGLAAADFTIGGARAQGMGGAGLALPIDVRNNYILNPAFLAFGSKNPALQFPQIGYRIDGIGFGDLTDVLGDFSEGVDQDGVLTLARSFGQNNIKAAFGANIGVSGLGFAVAARGEVGINSTPNEALRNWDGNNSSLTGNERLDAYGYAYRSIDVGYGNALRVPAGRLAIGANARFITSNYAHKFVDANGIQNGTVQNGSGIPAGQDTVEEQGVAVDLGLLYSPKGQDNLYIGLVVENFVQPNLNFDVQQPGGGAFDPLNPFPRVVSIGIGAQVGKGLLLAGDLVDIGNAASRKEARVGAELGLSPQFAIRAGYNSRTSFVWGFSAFGINVHFAGNAPLSLNSAIRF